LSDHLAQLLAEIRACRACVERPRGRPLPHEPRPVIRATTTARIAICGQAPGTRVHASGVPFTDPSGDRLRDWMGVTPDEFYDERRIAIVPMGFCFPGLDAKGSDLPPRKECAPLWRGKVFTLLPKLQLVLAVGGYAQRWHMAREAGSCATVSELIKAWRQHLERADGVPMLPLPHPSWRNSGWLKANPWFAAEVLPELRQRVRNLL
jgi:uracil-DNA glycosylase